MSEDGEESDDISSSESETEDNKSKFYFTKIYKKITPNLSRTFFGFLFASF